MSQFKFFSLTLVSFLLPMAGYSPASSGEMVEKDYLGTVPLYQMIHPNADANVVFFIGGPGWWGNLKSNNFLVRERLKFFSKGINVYLFPNKKKKYKMTYEDRLKGDHISRIQRLVEDIEAHNSLPIFLVGISRGAVSSGKFVSEYGDQVDGLILLSGIYFNAEITKKNAYSMQTVIGKTAPTNVLVAHHQDDCCKVCQASSAKRFYEELIINTKTLQIFSGGGSTGSCNGPYHHHGFEGIEEEVVENLVKWIKSLN